MRIVLDGRTIADHFPGIGRYTFNLADSLAPLLPPGDELIVLHDNHQPNTRFDLGGLADHPSLRLLEINARNFSLAEQWRVPGILRGLGVTVYHSPYYLMPYLPGCPSVVTVHDLIPMRYPADYSPGARLIYAVAVRLAVQMAGRVIAGSRAGAGDLQARLRVPPSKLATIAYAPDPIFRPQPAGAIERLRARYGLPEAYVLYLGSNKPHKNLARLVRAFAREAAVAPSAGLVIAGHWDERYPHAKAAAQAVPGRVRFLGPVAQAELPALYAGATLFAFPSLYEGFGLPPLEAMACGAPVISSNAPALVEVAGDAALLFDPLDESAIGAALERALRDRDLRVELGRRGLRRAQEFTWAQAARQTLETYRTLP